MKYVAIITPLFLFILSCSPNIQRQYQRKYPLTAQQGRYAPNEPGKPGYKFPVNREIADDTSYQILAPVTLTNTTKDTLFVCGMTCPANSYYDVDSKELVRYEHYISCTGNVPHWDIILPHQSKRAILKLTFKDKLKPIGEVKYRVLLYLYNDPKRYIGSVVFGFLNNYKHKYDPVILRSNEVTVIIPPDNH